MTPTSPSLPAKTRLRCGFFLKPPPKVAVAKLKGQRGNDVKR